MRSQLSTPTPAPVDHAPDSMFMPLEPRAMMATATIAQITSSTAASTYGQNVSFTVSVAPAQGTGRPTGLVELRDGSNVIATAPLAANGQAFFDIYNLFRGNRSISARYLGDTNFEADASDPVSLRITRGAVTVTSSGLQTATVTPGTGPGAANGQQLQVNYTGYLSTDGSRFDSSLNPGRTPFNFRLGSNQVIAGWEEGMLGLQAGETRVLIIPPSLAYGSTPRSGIPANSTLVFIVQALSFQSRFTPNLQITGSNVTPIQSGGAPNGQAGTSFGAVTVASRSPVSTFVLSAGNSTPLFFTQSPGITITGVNPRQFAVSSITTNSSGETIFTVQFAPTGTGFRRATISIFTNDPVTPVFQIRVNGTGV